MFNKIVKLARDPRVQKFAVWAAPIVIGWVLKKLDEKPASKKVTTSKSAKTGGKR